MTERPRPTFADEASRGIGMSNYLPMPITELGDGTDPLPVTQGRFRSPAHAVDADGRLGTGLLSSITDSIGGVTSGLSVLPDWIVTTNLTLRRAPDALVGTRGTGELIIDTRVMRRGRSSVVTRSLVADTDGHAVATSWMTCAVLTPEGGHPPFTRPVRLHDQEPSTDPLFRSAPEEFFGLESTGVPGQVLLHPAAHLRNPWGILHGGSVAFMIDTAARGVVVGSPEPEPTPGAIVTDLVIHYMSPGRVGPVSATAEIIGMRGRDALVRVEARDRGADDRLMTLAVATVRLLSPTTVTDR